MQYQTNFKPKFYKPVDTSKTIKEVIALAFGAGILLALAVVVMLSIGHQIDVRYCRTVSAAAYDGAPCPRGTR